MDDGLAGTFAEASRFLADVVGQVPDEAWEAPGLGSWNVRELVAHANRAQTTVEEYLLSPRAPEPPGSTYFSQQAIAERARQAVAALGADPAASVAATSDRVVALVGRTPLDATVSGPAGTVSLQGYLPSRIAELTIHGLDVLAAIGAEGAPPPGALAESLAFVGRASARHHGVAVLRALTGRGDLPPGFSVYTS